MTAWDSSLRERLELTVPAWTLDCTYRVLFGANSRITNPFAKDIDSISVGQYRILVHCHAWQQASWLLLVGMAVSRQVPLVSAGI